MALKRSSYLALLLVIGLIVPAFAASKELKTLKKDIAKASAADDSDSVSTLLREMADLDEEDAYQYLYDAGYEHATTPKLYEEVLKLLAGKDGSLEFVKVRYDKIDGKGDFRERVYLVDITAGISGSEATTQLGMYLGDKSPFVQGAAVDYLSKSQQREAIQPLIDLLEKLVKKRRDVLYHQVCDALWILTGQDFPVIDEWIKWWAPNKDSFDPKASTAGTTGVERKRSGEDPDFWGVPIESKNIVFVIDTSGSMKYVMKNDIPGLAHGDGSDSGGGSGGGQMTQEQIRLAEFWTRMSMAKRELTRVIRKLDKAAFFNCVRFDTTASKFLKQAVPGTPGNKNKAFKWIESIKDKGNTATLEALVEAFQSDARTNTIYFLSDGLPSKDGKNTEATRPILDKLFEMNRFRKIKIHTFGFYTMRYPDGTDPNPDLVSANKWLKELADATGGKFTVMTVDEKRTPDNPDGK